MFRGIATSINQTKVITSQHCVEVNLMTFTYLIACILTRGVKIRSHQPTATLFAF